MSFDSAEKVLLDFGWYKGPALWKKLLNQVFQVDLVQTLGSNDFNAVLFELIFPATLNEFLSKILLKSFFFSALLQLSLDNALLYSNVLILLRIHFQFQ